MSKNFQPLSSGEVLSVNSDSQIVIGHGTFRVGEFTTALKQLMLEHGVGGITPDNVDWLTADGVDCDVLRFGSNGWVKGKVRLHLEFSEEGDGEASPDPKTEAAIESIAPVAAITSLGSDVESTEALDSGEEFDLADPIDESPEPLVEAPEVFGKETITAKDTFVQSEEDSFDDLFGDEKLTEETDDLFGDEELTEETSDIDDDSFDDLFEVEDTLGEGVAATTPEATDDDSFDDLFDDSDDLLAESITDEADQESFDDLELGLDDDLTDDDLGFNDEPTETEAIATDDTPELDNDNFDDLFADSADAELDDSDDNLGFDDLVDTTSEFSEPDSESGNDLGLDALMLEEDSATDEDLLADPFDELGESEDVLGDDADFSLEELTEDDNDTEAEAALDDLSPDTATETDFSLEELGEDDTDFDLGDLDADDDALSVEEETSAAELEDSLDLGGDESDDFSFDALDDGDDFDLDALGGDDGELSLEEASATGLEDGDLGLGDEESDDFSFDDGDDGDFDLENDDSPSLDELSAEVDDFDLADDNADFSFTEEVSDDLEGMDNFFGDEGSGDSISGALGDDVADTEASGDEDMSFDNPFEVSEDSDLTQDELPPEVDFGSTEDLGEFIDVSMFRKKPASISGGSMDSPFDELEGGDFRPTMMRTLVLVICLMRTRLKVLI